MWGSWEYGSCSASCGNGIINGHRTCNSPSPSGGGSLCALNNGQSGLEDDTTTACNINPCDVQPCMCILYFNAFIFSSFFAKSLIIRLEVRLCMYISFIWV